MSWLRKKYPQIKQILLGDAGVGKSTLALRISKKQMEETSSTVGCSVSNITIATPEYDDIELCVWDVAGQERYQSIIDIYFKDIDVCFFVYDVNRPETLTRIFDFWINKLFNRRYAKDEKFLMYLIGNKEDLNPTTKQKDEIRDILIEKSLFLSMHQIQLWTISAWNDKNIDLLMKDMHKRIMKDIIPEKSVKKSEPHAMEPYTMVESTGIVNTNTWWIPLWSSTATSSCNIL